MWLFCDMTRAKFWTKIRRGPKLEGYAFANFGYSSGTEGESRHEIGNSCWVSFKSSLYFQSLRVEERSDQITSGLVPVSLCDAETRSGHFRFSSGLSMLRRGQRLVPGGMKRSSWGVLQIWLVQLLAKKQREKTFFRDVANLVSTALGQK